MTKKHSNNVSHAVQEARPDALVSFGLLGDGAKGMKSQERVEAGQDEVGNLSPAAVLPVARSANGAVLGRETLSSPHHTTGAP